MKYSSYELCILIISTLLNVLRIYDRFFIYGELNLSQMDDRKKVVENLNSIFNRYSGKEKLENEIEKLQSHLLEM